MHLSVQVDMFVLSVQTDRMVGDEILASIESGDPAVGLRAVGALRRLAEQVEAAQVRLARERGWSWEQIGAGSGVSARPCNATNGKWGSPSLRDSTTAR